MEDTINTERMLENVGRVLNGLVRQNEGAVQSHLESIVSITNNVQKAVAEGDWYSAGWNVKCLTQELPQLERALVALNTLEPLAPVRDFA